MRPPNADLNMTLALATLTFTVVQVLGIRAHGAVGRVKHMANPPFLFPIELISEFSRIISLSARLFGNVFAGEVLLGSIYAMVTAIVASISAVTIFLAVIPVIFILLELLFGTIQALVFALLTLIYIAQAATHDDHGHAAAHDQAHHPAVAPGGTPAPAGAAD
jgi:F-type H+-transporting ATPase subunit a